MTDQYLTGSDARSNMNSRATPGDGRESRGISRLKTLIPSSIVARTSPKQTRHPAARPAKAAWPTDQPPHPTKPRLLLERYASGGERARPRHRSVDSGRRSVVGEVGGAGVAEGGDAFGLVVEGAAGGEGLLVRR